MGSENQQNHQAELQKRLWDMANSLRGQMEASEFKNYILGLIFYRYLSDKIEIVTDELLANDDETYAQAWENEEFRQAISAELISQVGYVIEPEFLFSNMVAEINKGENGVFDVEMLQKGTSRLIESTKGENSQDDFDNLFDDLDLNSSKLGRDVKSRSELIAKIMASINSIPFSHDDIEFDLLGDSYEFLVGKFAATAGKSAGEFYTPQQVSKILAKIVGQGKERLKNVYDPTCGSGSLLLRVARETEVGHYYGQELTSTTFNLSRMNMMLHGVPYDRFDIKNANTLTEPQHLDKKFEAIVANPPYSAHWPADESYLTDERFSGYGKLSPKTKADFAFVQHMIHHLEDNGTMAVVLPHGVLFRGAAEGVIRQFLIKNKNYLDAVIGLPANIFYGTSIPTCILVFKKCRKDDDKILFIDASNDFEKGKNSNSLRDTDVEKIVDTYAERKEIDKYSHLATLKSIADNAYNLNIPRYVDSSEMEEKIDLEVVQEKISVLDKDISIIDQKISTLISRLVDDSNPFFDFIKLFHSEVLESSPTLNKTAFVWEKNGYYNGWGMTLNHDGTVVESTLEKDYPMSKSFLKKYSDMNNLISFPFILIIEKDNKAYLYSTHSVNEVVTSTWGELFSDEERDPNIRWSALQKILETSNLIEKYSW